MLFFEHTDCEEDQMHQFIALPPTRASFHSALISFNLYNVAHVRTPQQKIKLDTASHLFDLFQAIPRQAVTSVRLHVTRVGSECQLMSALL